TDQSILRPSLWSPAAFQNHRRAHTIRRTSDALGEANGRQQERALSDHRRAARRRRRVELQPLSGKTTAGGLADQCRPRRPEDPEQMMRTALAAFMLLALAGSARAEIVSREQDIVELRLGQRGMVDDGSCPAGPSKEVPGAP